MWSSAEVHLLKPQLILTLSKDRSSLKIKGILMGGTSLTELGEILLLFGIELRISEGVECMMKSPGSCVVLCKSNGRTQPIC